MKSALCVHRINNDLESNINTVISEIKEAAELGADIIIFSETALTGLENIDVPEEDIKLGIEMSDDRVKKIFNAAKSFCINVAIGIFEKEDDLLYDTALLINRKGDIGLKYRRISKGWHDPKMIDSIYKEGESIGIYEAEDLGRVCFLICGDLFEDELVRKVKEMKVDFLLFPYARSFYDGEINQEKWDKEMEEYKRQVKLSETHTLGTNYLKGEYFGGAFVVDKNGDILANLPVGKEGILVYEF